MKFKKTILLFVLILACDSWALADESQRLYAAGLRAANAWLFRAASRPQEILVDEAGPLEIEGGGMAPGLRAVLGSALRQKVYLVVRSGCLEAVCRRFGIRGYGLVDIAAGAPKS